MHTNIDCVLRFINEGSAVYNQISINPSLSLFEKSILHFSNIPGTGHYSTSSSKTPQPYARIQAEFAATPDACNKK